MTKLEQLINQVKKSTNNKSKYKKGSLINTNNASYSYSLSESYGTNIDNRLKDTMSPNYMLKSGIFEGRYLNDDVIEFPKKWYIDALKSGKLSPDERNVCINKFKIKSGLPLSKWEENGWLYGQDKKGWFQWWCRYYIGRRLPITDDNIDVDEIQIKRWVAYKRHWSQLKKNIEKEEQYNNEQFRAKQRQSLLQWGWEQPDKI